VSPASLAVTSVVIAVSVSTDWSTDWASAEDAERVLR